MTFPGSTLLSKMRNGYLNRTIARRDKAQEGRARFRARLRAKVNDEPTRAFPYLILLEGLEPGRDADTLEDGRYFIQ